MSAKLITPAQAAQLLGIGGSTLRLWCSETHFANHLSEAARGGAGRRRHFAPKDISTLTRARDLLRNGKSVADVRGLLAVVEPDAGSAELVTVAALSDEVQSTRAALVSLADELRRRQDDHAAALAAQQTEHTAQLAQLADEVATMRAELDALRSRSWLARLFNRG